MKSNIDTEPSTTENIVVPAETRFGSPFQTEHISDAQIAEAARNAIDAITTIGTKHLEINVHGGHVELAGHVASGSQRHVIEDLIDTLPGVRGVTNLLEVRSPQHCGDGLFSDAAGNTPSVCLGATEGETTGTWLAIATVLLLCLVATYLFWAKMVGAWPF